MAMDGAGRFVTAWVELDLRDNNENVLNPTRDGSEASILARLFDADGTPLGSDFVVNTTAEGFQAALALAMSPTGHLVAVWVGPDASFRRRLRAGLWSVERSAAGAVPRPDRLRRAELHGQRFDRQRLLRFRRRGYDHTGAKPGRALRARRDQRHVDRDGQPRRRELVHWNGDGGERLHR